MEVDGGSAEGDEEVKGDDGSVEGEEGKKKKRKKKGKKDADEDEINIAE